MSLYVTEPNIENPCLLQHQDTITRWRACNQPRWCHEILKAINVSFHAINVKWLNIKILAKKQKTLEELCFEQKFQIQNTYKLMFKRFHFKVHRNEAWIEELWKFNQSSSKVPRKSRAVFTKVPRNFDRCFGRTLEFLWFVKSVNFKYEIDELC